MKKPKPIERYYECNTTAGKIFGGTFDAPLRGDLLDGYAVLSTLLSMDAHHGTLARENFLGSALLEGVECSVFPERHRRTCTQVCIKLTWRPKQEDQ